MFGNNTTTQQIDEIIQAMAAEAGFDVTLRPTEFAALQKEAQAGNFDVDQIGWSGRVDPDGNIHQFVTCKGGLNDGKYCNEAVDKLLNEARVTTDEAEAQEALRRRAGDPAGRAADHLPLLPTLAVRVFQEGGGLQGLSRRDDASQRREVRLLIGSGTRSRPQQPPAGATSLRPANRRKPMLRYIARRVLIAIPTLLIVSVMVFTLQQLLPGDPVLDDGG